MDVLSLVRIDLGINKKNVLFQTEDIDRERDTTKKNANIDPTFTHIKRCADSN